jgi:hypothetical protein
VRNRPASFRWRSLRLSLLRCGARH